MTGVGGRLRLTMQLAAAAIAGALVAGALVAGTPGPRPLGGDVAARAPTTPPSSPRSTPPVTAARPAAAAPSTALPVATARPASPSASPRLEAGTARPGPVGRWLIAELSGPEAPEALTGYVWPLPKARLTRGFGPVESSTLLVGGQPFHDGIDLAAWCGAPVRAAHGGTVLASGRAYAGWIGWRGDLTAYRERLDRLRLWRQLPIVIVIDDGNGYRSMYVHLWKVRVVAGEAVEAGQVIGSVGATGGATGCHLHYTLFSPDERGSFALDPETAARRLLPATIVARVDPLRALPPLEEGGIRLMPGMAEPEPLILSRPPVDSAGR